MKHQVGVAVLEWIFLSVLHSLISAVQRQISILQTNNVSDLRVLEF
jgi:hypothetical protein